MYKKETHGKFYALKQISFSELYTCSMCIYVAHLASFKSNILIISTSLPSNKCTFLETPYGGQCKYFNTNPRWIHSR